MSDYYWLTLNCAYCDYENKEVSYADYEFKGHDCFICGNCGAKNRVTMEFIVEKVE